MPHSHRGDPIAPRALDVVRFAAPIEGWPAGTEGTVVEAFEESGFVELEDGELVAAPYRNLTVVWTSRSAS